MCMKGSCVTAVQVRKKAIMALHRFEQLDPEHDGPLASAELEVHFRRMLCDKVTATADSSRPLAVSDMQSP